MKHVRKFNEQVDFDSMYFNKKPFKSDNPIEDFYKEYKKVFDDNDVAEEGEEMGDGEIVTEVGELINKYNLSKKDVQELLDNYNTSFDYLKTLEWELKEWDKFEPLTHDDIISLYQKEEKRDRDFISFIEWLEKNKLKIIKK